MRDRDLAEYREIMDGRCRDARITRTDSQFSRNRAACGSATTRNSGVPTSHS